MPFLRSHPSCFLRQSVSLACGLPILLGCLICDYWGPAYLCSPVWGLKVFLIMSAILIWVWGMAIGSLCGKDFTGWTVSPALSRNFWSQLPSDPLNSLSNVCSVLSKVLRERGKREGKESCSNGAYISQINQANVSRLMFTSRLNIAH